MSDVSKAAERYAAAKVEEIRRDVSSRKNYSEDTEDSYRARHSYQPRVGSSVGAAQELSAARVEAMMAQLSGSLDEAEI